MALNLQLLRELLESRLDWEYVESEGPDTIRFDMSGGQSLWVHSSGQVEGLFRLPTKYKNEFRKAVIQSQEVA